MDGGKPRKSEKRFLRGNFDDESVDAGATADGYQISVCSSLRREESPGSGRFGSVKYLVVTPTWIGPGG